MSEAATSDESCEGGCDCGQLRYRMTSRPLFVQACHCRWCQRESGSAFALNAWIESDRVVSLAGEPEIVDTPSASGRGQKVARCPACRVAIWSHYSGTGPVTKFVRVGTLDAPDKLPPGAHIFTSSKQPWVTLDPTTPAFAEFYDMNTLWPEESLQRFAALKPAIAAYRATIRPA